MTLTRRTCMAAGLAAVTVTARARRLLAQPGEDSRLRMPSYAPPARGAPGGRIGGGSRGSQDEVPSVLVLAPDHVGLSITDQPVLYWYLSLPVDGASITVTLAETGGETVLSRKLDGKVERGIHALPLADENVHLKLGAQYEWRVSYATEPGKAITSKGLLSYADAKAGVKKDIGKAKPDDLPFVYAAAGYWYDALQALGTLIAENPTKNSYKLMRAALLDQVKLHDPADYDRESAS